MKKLTLSLSIVIFSFLSLLTSCGSDDNDSKKEETQSIESPEVFLADTFNGSLEKFILPENLSNSSDENAVLLANIIESNKATVSAFSGLFVVPENAVSTSAKSFNAQNNNERFTWSDGAGNSVIYTLEETADRYNITYVFTIDGTTSTLFEGYITKDGNKARITFNPSQEEQELTFDWEITETSFVYNIITFNNQITSVVNNDGTGSLAIFEEGTKTTEYLWNADGSGSATDILTGETFTWAATV